MPPRQDRAVPAAQPAGPPPDHATTRQAPAMYDGAATATRPRLASMAKVWKRLKREAT
ncbi:hypothetical protein [Achromobacter dolens]|uniref:hypothetical protein n=1 Tax=Achromobacter dolens TaxID=1287738 RepID=UPI0015817B36|nr:hypothetical protein [Achromobacter dolens]